MNAFQVDGLTSRLIILSKNKTLNLNQLKPTAAKYQADDLLKISKEARDLYKDI